MKKKVRFSDKVMIRYYNPTQKNTEIQQKKIQWKYIILLGLLVFIIFFFFLY